MIKKIFITTLGITSLTFFTFASNDSLVETGSTISTGTTEEMICTNNLSPVCDKEGTMYRNNCLAGNKETSFEYCKKPINIGDEKVVLQRAYDKGITKFNTLKAFQGSYPVTRAQAAKMLSIRGKLIYPEIGQTLKLDCKFTDIKDQTSDLQDYIIQSCQYGLFQGHQGRFMPKQYITKGQMLIVLKRIIGIKYANIKEQPEKVLGRKSFYDTAGATVSNSVDKMFFLAILAHSYNILSDSLSFNSSIW